MNKIIIFIVICSAFGCKKDTDIPKNFTETLLISERQALPDAIQLLEMLEQPTDGYIYITSYCSLSSQEFRGPEISIGGYGFNKNAVKSDFGNLSISNNIIPISATNDYQTLGLNNAINFFGSDLDISLSGENGLPGFNTVFRVPPLMTVTTPQYSNNSSLNTNSNISWVPDSLNNFGIGIAITFDPLGPENKGKNFSGDRITKFIHTEDDGSYNFLSTDVSGIPNGAKIIINIGRGNYARVHLDNGYYFGLITYSVIGHSFIVQN